MRDKFAGLWQGTLTCDAPATSTQVEIRKLSGEPGRLLIAGVWFAQITGSTAFEVPLQQMRDPNSNDILLVNGRGELQGNTLTLRMLYSNPAGGGFVCTFTLTRS